MHADQEMWQPLTEGGPGRSAETMGVIQGFHAPAGHSGLHPLDREAAELFLRAQASWLHKGLDRACDATAVGMVLNAHDAAHPSWLALIAAVQDTSGAAPAQALAALYTLHGRIAGVLCRGPDPRLSHAISGCVRSLLSDRLTELTDAAVEAVARAHASHAAGLATE